VVKDEGLRSRKAIAFIRRKSNPRETRLKAKNYSISGISLQKTAVFSENTLSFRNVIPSFFNKKIGEEIWKR
jgi:hypothetical protein